MCCCGKPTINGEKGAYSWDGKTFSTRPVNPPDLEDGDELLFDEPGRCGGLDSHCHHFRVVLRSGLLYLLVRNGSGDHRRKLGHRKVHLPPLKALDSNDRYWMLQLIYHHGEDGWRDGRDRTVQEYRQAFADGRLKKKKDRGRDTYSVWIEPKIVEAANRP